jgi:hypothetical protein
MGCPNNSKYLCERVILSQAVTFAEDTLTINIPSGSYGNKEKYCLIVAQEIPDDTTIAATVVITIGTDTTTYPLLSCCGAEVTASQIEFRRKYPVVVCTSINSGAFMVLEKLCCGRSLAAPALPIETTTTDGAEG